MSWPAETLPERPPNDESLELSDELASTAQLEVDVDPLLDRLLAQLLEPSDLTARRSFELEVGKRGTAPDRERVTEKVRTRLGIPSLCFRDQPLEEPKIELVGLDVDPVSRRARDDQALWEDLAQLRDEVLKHVRRRLRRPLAPELVDQSIGRDHLAVIDQEQGKEGSLLLARERNGGTAVDDLEGAEDPKLEHPLVVHDLLPPTMPDQAPRAERLEPSYRDVRAPPDSPTVGRP